MHFGQLLDESLLHLESRGILRPGHQAVPAEQVAIGDMVIANGKGEQPVHGFRDGQAFFVDNAFDEGNEIRVNRQGFLTFYGRYA